MTLTSLLERLMKKLQGWAQTIVEMLPNLAMAVLVAVAFGLAAKWVSRGFGKVLDRFIDSSQIVSLLTTLVRVAILAAGLFTALDILHLDKAVTSLLAGVGIVGLALGFAFQDIAANFVSGILMAMRRPFSIGDLIEVDDHFGHVDKIDLRATQISLLSGETVLIPNKNVFQNALVNYTKTECRRVDIPVGVSYGDDLRRAKELALEAIRGLEPRDGSQDVELFYTGFGASSIDFVLRFWIEDAHQAAFLAARSEAVMLIKEAFDAEGITIPFPIRTLDFGIVGGEPLAEQLRPARDQDGGHEAAAE